MEGEEEHQPLKPDSFSDGQTTAFALAFPCLL
jgi:hypothetical protein